MAKVQRRARPSRRKNAGNEHVLAKLESSVKNGDHYHAFQMYQTMWARWSPDNFDDATKLVVSGVGVMLEHNQPNSAAELGLLLVNYYTSKKCPVSDDKISMILELGNKFTAGLELNRFLNAAINWSSAEGRFKRGDPQLRLLLARKAREAGTNIYINCICNTPGIFCLFDQAT